MAFVSTTQRFSTVNGAADSTVLLAETWTICTVKVPSAAAGAHYVYTDSGAVGEAFKPEPGDTVTLLLPPGTELQIATTSAAAVEYSVTQMQVPIGEVTYALEFVRFVLAVYMKQMGFEIPETELIPPFRGKIKVSSKGPAQRKTDPLRRLKKGA